MSPSLRWWSPWWWPLVHLRSFRCRLLDGSHYTRLANVRQIETTQTPPKPLQTLASIGVSQPHDGDTKTADATATATARHGHTQGRHGHVTTATPRDATARRTQPRHDGRPRRARHSHGHDVQGATPCHGHDVATTGTAMIAYKGTCPRDSTRHATRQPNKHSSEQTFDRTHVPMLHIQQPPPWGSPPGGQKAGPLAL